MRLSVVALVGCAGILVFGGGVRVPAALAYVSEVNIDFQGTQAGTFTYFTCEVDYGCYRDGYYTQSNIDILTDIPILNGPPANPYTPGFYTIGNEYSANFSVPYEGFDLAVSFSGVLNPKSNQQIDHFSSVGLFYSIIYTDYLGNTGQESGSILGDALVEINTVPLPASISLLGFGLASLGTLGLLRRSPPQKSATR